MGVHKCELVCIGVYVKLVVSDLWVVNSLFGYRGVLRASGW